MKKGVVILVLILLSFSLLFAVGVADKDDENEKEEDSEGDEEREKEEKDIKHEQVVKRDLRVLGNIFTVGKVFASAYSSLSPLIFEAPAGVERARIDDVTGNLGIGTQAPQEKLTVTADSNIAVELATPTNVKVLASSGGFLSSGTYYFKIVASDGIGTTTGSSEVSCMVDGVNTNRCSLSWSAVPGASLYRIYKGASSNSQDLYQVSSTNAYDYDKDAGATLGAVPTVTTAYMNKFSASGNSWLLGGKLGIGTATPSAKLDVRGDVDVNAGTETHLSLDGATFAALNFLKNGAALWSVNDLSKDFRVDESSGLPLLQGDPCPDSVEHRASAISREAVVAEPIFPVGDVGGSVNRLIIKKCTGKVGIGTTDPREKLHVVNGGVATDSFFSFSKVQKVAPSDSVYINAPRDDNLGIFTGSKERLTVGSNGYVGVGTTAPQAGLHVKGANWPASFLYLDTEATGQDAGIRLNEAGAVKYHLYHDAKNEVFRIDTDAAPGLAIAGGTGNVGLGTITPTERLDLGGGNINMGYEIVSHQVPVSEGLDWIVDVFCPAGKKVLSGGCFSYTGSSLLNSYPHFKSGTGWRCMWEDASEDNTNTAYAICANIR